MVVERLEVRGHLGGSGDWGIMVTDGERRLLVAIPDPCCQKRWCQRLALTLSNRVGCGKWRRMSAILFHLE